VDSEDIYKTEDKTKVVPVLNKEGSVESREIINLSSQMRRGLRERTLTSIKALATVKKKKKKTGKLKFKSRVNSIPLQQFGVTYRFSGPKYLVLQGFKKAFKIEGFKQIPKDAEFANANLVRKASGYYLKVTCFLPKEEKIFAQPEVGIDFGIKTSLTLSNEEKFDLNFPVSGRTKKLQRQIKNKKNGSNNKYKHQNRINRAIERTTNQKKDKRNKIVSCITNKFETVMVQDESIKAWHSSRFGKKVQSSSIGGIMSDLKKKSHTLIVVDRFFPSTKLCHECGTLNKPSLSERIYVCDCGYVKDRDVHSALNILREGLKQIGREPINPMPVEEMLDFNKPFLGPLKLFPAKQEARGFSLG
jgi:putative transposase